MASSEGLGQLPRPPSLIPPVLILALAFPSLAVEWSQPPTRQREALMFLAGVVCSLMWLLVIDGVRMRRKLRQYAKEMAEHRCPGCDPTMRVLEEVGIPLPPGLDPDDPLSGPIDQDHPLWPLFMGAIERGGGGGVMRQEADGTWTLVDWKFPGGDQPQDG